MVFLTCKVRKLRYIPPSSPSNEKCNIKTKHNFPVYKLTP